MSKILNPTLYKNTNLKFVRVVRTDETAGTVIPYSSEHEPSDNEH